MAIEGHDAARETADREGVAAAKIKCLYASLTHFPPLPSTDSRRDKRSITTPFSSSPLDGQGGDHGP